MHANLPPELARRVRPEPGLFEFTVLVALMMGVTAFAVDAVLPAFPDIGRSFGVTEPNRLQLVVYVYMLGFGFAQLIYGPASDIVGRRPAYLTGVAVFVVGSVLTLFATDLATMLAARFIQGTGAAAGRVLSTAIVRDRYGGRDMARVLSLNMTVFIMVPIFAPSIGSLLLLLGGWRVLCAAMLLLGVAVAAWFWRRMPETLKPENRMPASIARIGEGLKITLTTRLAMGYATAVAFLFGCIMSMVGSAQQIFAETYGLARLFPLAFALLATSMGAAGFANSALVRRFGMRRISHATLLVFVALGIVQLASALAFSGHPPLWLFAGILAASQFLLGMTFPNFNALAMEPLGKVAGTASSLIGVYTTVVGSLCGIVVGASFNDTVIPIATGYAVLGLGALAVVLHTERGRLFVPRHPDPRP